MTFKGEIKAIYLFPTGQVATFGYDDQQIPELQGPYNEELHLKLIERSDPLTKWHGFEDVLVRVQMDQAVQKKAVLSVGKVNIPEGYNFSAEFTDVMLENFRTKVAPHMKEAFATAKIEKKGNMNLLLMNLNDQEIEILKQIVNSVVMGDTPKPSQN